MIALQESVLIHITPDSEDGAILSYQAECNDGAKSRKVDCSPEVVQRSRVLQELIATCQDGPCTTQLPICQDTFSAWHDFDAQKKPSAQALCGVLQVRADKHELLPL